jgi:hypothetical protein
MDTLSDPFRFETEVLLLVVFAVLFTPLPGVVTVGVIVIVVVVFSACLVVVVTHPVATISPTTIHRENGTISFIGCLLHDVCLFFDISILQGTGAMQVGSDAGENLG